MEGLQMTPNEDALCNTIHTSCYYDREQAGRFKSIDGDEPGDRGFMMWCDNRYDAVLLHRMLLDRNKNPIMIMDTLMNEYVVYIP